MLKGRCALITGSTQGLGYAMAERLAAEGCNIVLNGFGDDGRDREPAPQARERSRRARAPSRRRPGRCRARSPTWSRRRARPSARSTSLINNAVVRYFAPIEKFKPEDWDRALAVNLSAAFHTMRLALPGMRERDFGRIVNIASIYGLFATVNRVDYVTTKTALIGFTRAVALETARPEHHLQRHLPRHRRRPPTSSSGWRRRWRSRASRARRPNAPSSPRASRRAASSRRSASRRWSPCCADRRAPTSPARPSRSTAAGAPADAFLGSDTRLRRLDFPATNKEETS